jgi:hypothetical protein
MTAAELLVGVPATRDWTSASREQGGFCARIRPLEFGRACGSPEFSRAVSSVGRAPARQAGGHWFEPSTAHTERPATRAFLFSVLASLNRPVPGWCLRFARNLILDSSRATVLPGGSANVKIERIEIENFRGFEGFSVDLAGASRFVIGENAGGKTSLFTAIARGLGRDLSFRRADFRDPDAPITITVTLSEISAPQRAVFGNNVDFGSGTPARVRVQARAVWDSNLEDAEAEHIYPKNSNRSNRSQREAIPLLWLPAGRDVARVLQFGVSRNVMGQLLEDLPIDQSVDQAVTDIRDASERLGRDAALRQFLDEASDQLGHLLPDVAQDAFTMGLSAATGRDLLRQFELVVRHLGEPIPISRQSTGVAQLSAFIFAMKLVAAQPGVILLVDEPEISLHPQAQRALVRALRQLPVQLLIATHSSNLLERADPRDVVRLGRRAGAIELATPAQLTDDEAEKFARFTNPLAAEAFFARAVLLVEGDSDRLAIEALAEKTGRNLDAEAVSVVPINGAANAATYIDLFGPRGFDLKIAGLCDEAEERYFAGGLDRAGIAQQPSRHQMEQLGFFVCVKDLEEEIVRALGVVATEQVINANGDQHEFDMFKQQPDKVGWTPEEHVLGFIRRGRKVQYAPLLVDALDGALVPAVLEGVLGAV